jgi:hypothetical protein
LSIEYINLKCVLDDLSQKLKIINGRENYRANDLKVLAILRNGRKKGVGVDHCLGLLLKLGPEHVKNDFRMKKMEISTLKI